MGDVVEKVMKSDVAKQRWKLTEVLVVDEVSMLDAELLSVLDSVGRAARNEPDVPFGGLQLIVTGDFYQLPPVTRGGGKPPFAFTSDAWVSAEMKVVELKEVLRQKDSYLVAALNEIRTGTVRRDGEASMLFRSLDRPLPVSSAGVLPTRLFCTNRNVDAMNLSELAKLQGEELRLEVRAGESRIEPVVLLGVEIAS